jgi:hypothetical protein
MNSETDGLNYIKINGIKFITEGSFNFDNNGFIKLGENFDDNEALKDFIARIQGTSFYKEAQLEILNQIVEKCQKVTVVKKSKFSYLDLEE